METADNMNTGLISIIVPIYNGEKFIDRCVKSIQAQTYKNWELLLMDGASTDNSPGLCAEWEKKDKRIHAHYSTEYRGVSQGRNMGLKNATGDYITFVDVDDWLFPDCLERLYADMGKSGAQIAGCGFVSCTDEDWERRREIVSQAVDVSNESGFYETRLISGKDFLKEGILNHDTRCWSKLYRREVTEGHFFNEAYTIGEDMLFVWEVTRAAELISVSEYKGYCYYHNVNGAMLKKFRENDMDQIRCWQFLLQYLNSENFEGRIYDTDVIIKTASILLISCMLVAGKLALLPKEERREYADLRRQCSDVLNQTLEIKGAYAGLDAGYRLKVVFFWLFPELYIKVYHLLKKF